MLQTLYDSSEKTIPQDQTNKQLTTNQMEEAIAYIVQEEYGMDFSFDLPREALHCLLESKIK